jgi:hypothetical protein
MIFRTPRQTLLAAAATACLALASAPASALTIELRNLGGAEVGTQAYDGFRTAARFWELALTNNVNVKLNVGFSALAPNVLGSTGSTTNGILTGTLLDALKATGDSKLDKMGAPTLVGSRELAPGVAAIDALISAPNANGNGVAVPLTRVLDNNDSVNNYGLSANTSLLKAIGITPTYTGANAAIQADGTVQFSTGFAFDFDPTNGIAANQIDFIGVAIHEIGHALGFRSGVDTYDNNVNFGGNLGNFSIMSVWDLFRYSDASISQGVRDWAIGGTLANGDAPFFSIDGKTIYDGDAYLSTGRARGDGRQASHWKDNVANQPQLGIMDPTVAFGQQSIIDSLDLAAMDAMGWNVAYDVTWLRDREFSTAIIGSLQTLKVPEPASAALVLVGLGAAGFLRRRRAAAQA